MDEININIEETNFCTIVQNDVSDFTVNLENPTTNFCVEVKEGIGAIPHTHPISDIIGLQSELDGLHTDVTNIENVLDLKADLVDGKVPSAQLPSYVDDVLEFANFASFPATGESGKIYVALDTNLTYRWSGSTYAEISPSLALGETSTTAYRGDRGKIAYDHSQITSGNPHGTTLDMVTDAGNTTNNIINVRGVSSDYYDVNTTPSLTLLQPGRIVWNSADGTYDMCLYNDVTLQAGQEQHFYGKAVGTIANGSPVQFAGSQGSHFLIKSAVASEINANPELFMGIATQSFTNNQFGYVTMFGNVRDLNTSAYTDGTLLYFDSVNGGLTSTKPAYPNARILVCAVTNSHVNQGSLFVRPEIQRYGKWNEIVNQPSTFTPSAHTHAIANVTGLQTSLDGKEPTITSGTTSQYWRGDKTWQTLDKSAVGLGNVVNLDTSNPTNISQNASYRFVTDTEKATWNSKQNALTNPITGTGTSGYIPKFNGTTTIANSVLYESSGSVGIGTTSPSNYSGFKTLTLNGTNGGVFESKVNESLGLQMFSDITTSQIVESRNLPLLFLTNSSERMRVTSSGNVGIGTTSPTYGKLVVKEGAAQFEFNTGSTKSQILSFDRTASVYKDLELRGDNLIFSPQDVERMRITSDGKLIIGGTSVPDSGLSTYTTNGTVGIGQYLSSTVGYIGTWTNHSFGLAVNGSEKMRITSGGNVGIGTESPSYKLDINGTGRFSSYLDVNYQASASNGSINIDSVDPTIRFRVSGGTANKRIYELRAIAAGTTNDRMELRTWNDAQNSASSLLSITNSGNVGIGTTSPSSKLHTLGKGIFDIGNTSGDVLVVDKVAGGNIAFNINGVYSGQIGAVGSGDLYIASKSTYPTIVVKDGGNVGIGTTSPATKLDVAGAITASGGFFNSDIRLKEIIDYEYSVLDIKPITYTWKDKRDDKKHVGYSAQEVQKVMPDAVNEDAEGMLSVNYIEVLVAKIEMLEKRIKQLENGLG